jgi:hypothetical protein
MIYSRFTKYLTVPKQNKRPFIRTFYDIVSVDARSPTGSNVRKILLDFSLDPRLVSKHKFSAWRAYLPADGWTVPLLISLLEQRSENWQVNLDMEEEI